MLTTPQTPSPMGKAWMGFLKINLAVYLIPLEPFHFKYFEGIKNHVTVPAKVEICFLRKRAVFQITGQPSIVGSFGIAA